MRFLYLDASALAKRYAAEAGTAVVNHLFGSVFLDRFYVFNVGLAEVLSILVRKKNAGFLGAKAFSQALVEVTAELVNSASLNRVVAGSTLVTAALPLIVTHSVNATDAIILRSALDVADSRRQTDDDLILVASDQRLLRAAQVEGLVTFDPETQSQADLDGLLVP